MSQKILLWLGKKAAEELKNLLENKHLYQQVNIDPAIFIKQQIEAEAVPVLKMKLNHWAIQELPKERFTLAQRQLILVGRAATAAPKLTLELLNVSLFCRECERREAFAPVWFSDVSNEIRVSIASGVTKQIDLPDGFQMFFLVYQCQRCQGKLEGFIIRRVGWSLALHGRSPMEVIEIPSFVPKLESGLFRDAVLAFNSGKALAGLFYLRTFVEQFARRITGITGKKTGDEILDAYYKVLPPEHKDHMPSLREWYDKLSEAIHSARPDGVLFETAKSAIEKHFEIRKVYDMPETKSQQVAVDLDQPSADSTSS